MKKTITLFSLVLLSFVSFSQVGLKINEVDYDQLSLDSAEFLELYNADVNAIDLGNFSVILINGNNNTPYDTIALPSFNLNPGDFYVICGNGGFVPNCDLVLPVYANIIQNGSPDAIAIVENGTGTIIDALSYEGSVAPPYVEGTGAPLAQSDTLVTTPLLGMGRFPDGMDTNDNSVDFHNACSTPGGANVNTNTNCVTAISTITHLISTFSVYPNPTKGLATIDCRGMHNASISVRNVLGREIKSFVLSSQESAVQLDLSDHPDGVYFIKMNSESGESTRRIVLKK